MRLWIGDKVEVKGRAYRNLKGEVVYETKNMLWLLDEEGNIKKVPKKGNDFLVNGSHIVHGSSITLKPWVRVVKDP
jgi:RNase P/RNase MRP subunit p29